jgi:hypothetical protein
MSMLVLMLVLMVLILMATYAFSFTLPFTFTLAITVLMLVSMLTLTLTVVVSWGAWTQDAASLRSQLDDARRAAADTKEVRAPRHAGATVCVCHHDVCCATTRVAARDRSTDGAAAGAGVCSELVRAWPDRVAV